MREIQWGWESANYRGRFLLLLRQFLHTVTEEASESKL